MKKPDTGGSGNPLSACPALHTIYIFIKLKSLFKDTTITYFKSILVIYNTFITSQAIVLVIVFYPYEIRYLAHEKHDETLKPRPNSNHYSSQIGTRFPKFGMISPIYF